MSATASPSVVRIWLMAARPKTLPVGLAPVLVGTALAQAADVFEPLRFAAALLGALFIQVGANLSNDYSDARRGADTEDRLGPVRVTAGGLVPPRQVLLAHYVAPPCVPEQLDAFVESMLSTRIGDDHYPGTARPVDAWPSATFSATILKAPYFAASCSLKPLAR